MKKTSTKTQKIRMKSGGIRVVRGGVVRGGYRAKAPPFAARPLFDIVN